MIENQDIVRGAITKTKLSKNLRLDLSNLPQGTAGQIPIIQSDGNWGLVDLSGDVSIAADGVTTVVNNATINSADIDTAFNFLTDQQGFVFRKGQQDYAVDNKKYATGTVAAAHADHANERRKFTTQIDWGSDQTAKGITYPEGSAPDFDGIVEIEHNLSTNFIVCSITDINGREKAANTQFDMNFEAEVLVTLISNNKIRLIFNVTFQLNDGLYVAILGVT